MAAALQNGRFHFRQGDLDGDGGEDVNASFDRNLLLTRIETLSARMSSLLTELTRKLGVDVWSRYLYDEPVVFGAPDWTPAAPPSSSAN
jgi:hypothetical protein